MKRNSNNRRGNSQSLLWMSKRSMRVFMGKNLEDIKKDFTSSVFASGKKISLRPVCAVGLKRWQKNFCYLKGLLVKHGYNSPEEMRKIFAIPTKRLLVREISPRSKTPTSQSSVDDEKDTLRKALILGLCNDYFYDPEKKSVVWTKKSLYRRVELYEAEGFYNE